MKIISLFIIVINLTLLFNFVELTPFSQCTKGRISPYYTWQNGGRCGFGSHTNAVGSTYIYPVAPNQDLFGNSAQCGVCYEMVGPKGAIKVRVEDYCPKDSELGYCSGNMFHFNIANNSVSYIMGNSNLANITFRMVSCDYTGNIKILTDKNTNLYYISFVVLDHNLAVSHVEIQEYGSEARNNITRNPNNNNWVYYNLDTGLNFPITLRIYSINGDYAHLTMNTIESNAYYEFNKNFDVPDDNTLFSISNLKKITAPFGYNKTKCCERDKSDFTPIYKDGVVNGGYKTSNTDSTIIYNSNEKYLDKYSLNIKFNSLGALSFLPSFPIRADQYRGISFRIKFTSLCNNLNLKYFNKDSTVGSQSAKISESTEWQMQTFNFDNSVISNNEFNGIQFVANTMTNCEVNIEDIHLISNPSAPDAGICYTNSPSDTGSDSEPITEPIDIDTSNSIRINNIIINENTKNILNVNCDRFIYLNNKKLKLKFSSKYANNNESFVLDDCTPSNSSITAFTSFTCKLPENIPNGMYRINEHSTDGFNFTFDKDIEIKNGLIIVGNVDSTMNKFIDYYYSPLIIINSKEQVINKGDIISFNVYPIPQEEYNLENDEIILLSNNDDLSLRLKYCHENVKNKIVYSVKCTVGNNVKGNFNKLYSDQIASLLDGQTLNLISNNPSGGIISKDFNHIMETTLTKAQKDSYSLTFDILYYNPNIRPSNEFPHKIYLQGTKRNSNKRALEISTANTRINLKNCTAGEYSIVDPSAIGSVKCLLPDYIPAGTYNKLDCDGIDMNPHNSINLILNRDFNRSSNNNDAINGTDSGYTGVSKSSSSSSKSKNWIIWVIVAVLIVILAGLVIIVLACRKKEDDEASTTKKDNDSSTAKNNESS